MFRHVYYNSCNFLSSCLEDFFTFIVLRMDIVVDSTFIPYVFIRFCSVTIVPSPTPEINGFKLSKLTDPVSAALPVAGKTTVLYYPVLFSRPTSEPRYRSRELYIFNPFKRLKATAAMTTARYIIQREPACTRILL